MTHAATHSNSTGVRPQVGGRRFVGDLGVRVMQTLMKGGGFCFPPFGSACHFSRTVHLLLPSCSKVLLSATIQSEHALWAAHRQFFHCEREPMRLGGFVSRPALWGFLQHCERGSSVATAHEGVTDGASWSPHGMPVGSWGGKCSPPLPTELRTVHSC